MDPPSSREERHHNVLMASREKKRPGVDTSSNDSALKRGTALQCPPILKEGLAPWCPPILDVLATVLQQKDLGLLNA